LKTLKNSKHGGRPKMTTTLTWRRDGLDWVLLAGKRRMGRVKPDIRWPGMWRSTLSGGRLSDMANLAWSKNAVLVAAERELEFEDRTQTGKHPSKCPENRGVLGQGSPPVAPMVAARGVAE
jgi:hypothetical protein